MRRGLVIRPVAIGAIFLAVVGGCLLAVLSGPTAAAESVRLDVSDLEPWLDGFMFAGLKQTQVAGAVVAVVKDGHVVLAKGYGYADVSKQLPVDPERTLFRPGSISKLFGATAVMQLVAAGKLDLDADVNQYLDFKIPARDGGPITLRSLLTHTAGFEEQAKDLINPTHSTALHDYVENFLPKRIYPVGTTPAYSNYGAALAGYIVQRVSGESFEDYVERHILAPLQMRHSTFRQPPPASVGRSSQGYDVASAPPKPFEFVNAVPAGALSSSGSDMANFMIMHLENGVFEGREVLNHGAARTMHDTESGGTWVPDRMLLGFYQRHINGHAVIVHGGDTELFHSDLSLFLDDDVGLYVSLNSTGVDGPAGNLRTLLFEAFADRYFPSPLTTVPVVDAATSAAHARLLSGVWESARRYESSFASLTNLFSGVSFVENEDGTISMGGPFGLGAGQKRYRETTPFVWSLVDGREWIAAEVKDGVVQRVAVNAYIDVFTRPPWWRSPAWLLPFYLLSDAVVFLTVLAWPITRFVRRHYRIAGPIGGAHPRAYRWSRCAALTLVTIESSWLFTSAFGLTKFSSPGLDRWVLALQVCSAVAYGSAAIVLVGSVWVVLRNKAQWTTRWWNGALAVGGLTLLWYALVFHLIGFSVAY